MVLYIGASLIPKGTVTHQHLLRTLISQPPLQHGGLHFLIIINEVEHLSFHLLINCISSPAGCPLILLCPQDR